MVIMNDIIYAVYCPNCGTDTGLAGKKPKILRNLNILAQLVINQERLMKLLSKK
jgi:hypothetical protein